MGMAASQARLLSITSRMADNELRAQIINNSKMRLASESSKVSEQYIQALNDATMMITNYSTTGEEQYQNLTFNALTAYSTYNNQYALINNNGNIFVSETDAANFKGAATLKDFLGKYGLEEKTTYFDQFAGNIDPTTGLTLKTNTGTYSFSQIKNVNDLEVMYLGGTDSSNNTHYGYDILTSRTSYNNLKEYQTVAQNTFSNMYYAMAEYIENTVHAYLTTNGVIENKNDNNTEDNKIRSTQKLSFAFKTTAGLIEKDNNDIPELDTTNTYNATKDTNYSKLKALYESLDYVYQLLGNKCYIDTNLPAGAEESHISDLKDENGNQIIDEWDNLTPTSNYNDIFTALNKIYKSLYADPTSYISNYQRLFDDSNIQLNETKEITNYNYTFYHKNADGTRGNQLTEEEIMELEKKDYEARGRKINEDGSEESCDPNPDNEIFVYNDDGIITGFANTEEGKKYIFGGVTETTQTVSAASTDYIYYNQLYTSLVYATDSDSNTTSNIDAQIYDTESPNINWDSEYLNAQWKANKKIIEEISGYDAESGTGYTFNGEKLTDSQNIYGVTNTNFDITQCWDLLGTYATLANIENGICTEAAEIEDAVILDALFDVYGEPEYAWCDSTDSTGAADADAKVQWYTNLYNHMKEGYTVLEDGLASSTEWIAFALESGLATIQQTDKNNQWKSTLYSNVAEITEVTDNAAVVKAEAEYNKAMNNIEAKDQRFDVELKNIDTEHTSLQTEYESIKSVISKNIERSFKMYS